MHLTLHKNATTTPRTRAMIQSCTLTDADAATKFGCSTRTIRRWRLAPVGEFSDRSCRPAKLSTTLTPAQEAVVLEVRQTLELSLDDLHALAREFLHPNCSRAAIGRLLARVQAPSLKALAAARLAAQGKPAFSKFKTYEPGFIHMDVKHLPAIKGDGESSKTYLYVAIDRATRWVYIDIYHQLSRRNSALFLQDVIQACPFRISKVLTDNGTEFAEREAGELRSHPLDMVCEKFHIEHRRAPVRRPQTNGMVERFNGRIAEILGTWRFDSGASLVENIHRYVQCYNAHIPQRALGALPPEKVIEQWIVKKPELFKKVNVNMLFEPMQNNAKHTRPDR